MFDAIIVETGLPDGASNRADFQTKDFGAALRQFRITPQGILEIRDMEWRPFDHQGLVTFHDGDRVYTAKFAHGLLVGIRTGDSDAWINVDEGVDPWEVLENVHTALKNLEYDSKATDRLRKYVAKALEGHLETGIGSDAPHSG
jgi:hypothetical protein